MAVNEEVLRMVVETKGVENVAALSAKLDALKAAAEANALAFSKGEIDAATFNARAKELSPTIAKLGTVVRDLEQAQKAEAAAAALAREEQERLTRVGAGFHAALQGLSREEEEAARAAGRLARQQEALSATTVKTSRGMHTLGDDAKHAAGGMAGFGQAGLQAGRVVQDFQAAGLMGITNNIEGLVMSLGGGAGMAGALTLLATAWLAAGPQIKDFFNTLTGAGSHEVPKSVEHLKALEEQLKKTGKELDDLREKERLTSDELARFNKLTVEQTKLEKERDEEQKRKADLDKLRALKPEGAESGERAKALQTAVGNAPSVDTLTAGIERTMVDRAKRERDELNKQIGPIVKRMDAARFFGRPVDPKDEAEYQRHAPRRDELSDLINDPAAAKRKAEDLARASVERGDKGATEQIAGMMKERPSLFPSGQVAGFQGQTEAGQAAAEQARGELAAMLQKLPGMLRDAVRGAQARAAGAEGARERQARQRLGLPEGAPLQQETPPPPLGPIPAAPAPPPDLRTVEGRTRAKVEARRRLADTRKAARRSRAAAKAMTPKGAKAPADRMTPPADFRPGEPIGVTRARARRAAMPEPGGLPGMPGQEGPPAPAPAPAPRPRRRGATPAAQPPVQQVPPEAIPGTGWRSAVATALPTALPAAPPAPVVPMVKSGPSQRVPAAVPAAMPAPPQAAGAADVGRAAATATAETQQAMNATQGAVGAVIGQLTRQGADARRLRQNANQLLRAAQPRGNTYLDSGGPGA